MINVDLHYLLHGLIVLMLGLLSGWPFAKAIKNKTGNEVAWRVVHSGASVAGVMLIAIGGLINRLSLSTVSNVVLLWGIVLSTYLLVAGMILAAISGERGIGKSKDGQNIKWKIVYYFYAVGAFMSVMSFATLIYFCACNLLK